MNYQISVHGCDDSSIFEMELTKSEAETVKRVADECTKTSTCGCMPIMSIETMTKPSQDQKK